MSEDRRPSARFLRLSVATAFAGAMLLSASALAQSSATPENLAKQVGLDQRLGEYVPLDAQWRNERGRTVSLRELIQDRPVILTLVYYRCPMLCTQVLNGVLKTSNAMSLELGRDYDIVSISIDPQETPEQASLKKERYVGAYRREGADSGWHFLTGAESEIQRLAAAVGYRYRYDANTDQYAHASGIIVLTPEGRISRYFYGIDYSPRDVRLGLVESSAGRIGTAVDQILLLCFHYDPTTGKYGLLINRVLQFAGTLTALTLGSYLWAMYRLERRRSAAVCRTEQCSVLPAASEAQPLT